MSKKDSLQELFDKFFGGKEPTIEQLIRLEDENPSAHSEFRSELGRILGFDLSEDVSEKLRNDPRIQQAIRDSARNIGL